MDDGVVVVDCDYQAHNSCPISSGDGSGVHNRMARRKKNKARTSGGKLRATSKVREHIELPPIDLPFDELLKRLLKVDDKIPSRALPESSANSHEVAQLIEGSSS